MFMMLEQRIEIPFRLIIQKPNLKTQLQESHIHLLEKKQMLKNRYIH
jgi:hypothetical protein